MRKSLAFTIVELMAVITVVSILASITIVSYNGITKRATVKSLENDLMSAASQLVTFKLNNGVYPGLVTDCPTPARSNICLKPTNNASFTSYTFTSSSFVLVETASDGSTRYQITDKTDPVKIP